MILAIDIGNSNICVGAYKDGEALFSARVRTDALKTETEYAVLFDEIFAIHRVSPSALEGAAISCVVPALTSIISDAVKMLADVPVMTVGPGIKTGLDIRIDNPSELAGDLVCTAVGAMEKYPLPAIIIDLGTATKITVVDENRRYIGGAIAPGVTVSLSALTKTTAMLPSVSLNTNIRPICGDTAGAMLSGSILGTASMLDGMIDRYLEALGKDVKTVVACGGLAKAVVPHCRRKVLLDPDLLLDGLLAIYRKNR